MRFSILLLCCFWLPLNQAEEAPLPEPLTLKYALQLAEEAGHPDMQAVDARQALAGARRQLADADYGLRVDMELQARWIDPSPLSVNQQRDDHYALLRIQKKLYDFGLSARQLDAETVEFQALKLNRRAEIERRKIDIARLYFDVILSDLRFAWQDEAMATAYVNYDRIKERHELKEYSDVELFRAEADYQKVRMSRYQAEIQQRRSRALLAEALNRPGQLSETLLKPSFSFSDKKLPDYEKLLDDMLHSNPQIKLSRQLVDAAVKRMQAARMASRPELGAEIDVAEYSRDLASNNAWQAGLYLNIPLFETRQVKARLAEYRAKWLQQKAELADIEASMRQRLLELWQDIGFLQVNHEQLMVELDARELALDKSRALYEMEVKTNLGNAMVDISEMQFRQAQLEFKLAIAWMELRWLLGEDVYVE